MKRFLKIGGTLPPLKMEHSQFRRAFCLNPIIQAATHNKLQGRKIAVLAFQRKRDGPVINSGLSCLSGGEGRYPTLLKHAANLLVNLKTKLRFLAATKFLLTTP